VSAPPPETLNQLFFAAVDRFSTKRAALRYKLGGAWHDVTHQQFARRVRHTAMGLRELGVQPGDRVAILSPNRPEWAMADFGCLTARCPDVAIYPTLPARQVAYILKDSGAAAVFVADTEQYAKVAEYRASLPDLKHVILLEGENVEGPGLISVQELLQRGAAGEVRYPLYREDALAVGADELATLIYTSGTTGDPKGVMLTHGNFTSNVLAALTVVHVSPNDACLSLLPLSHAFERMGGYYVMFHAGVTINYAENMDTVPANMLEIRPAVVLGVPRLYEKIYARVLDTAVHGGAVKRRIFFWAKRVGEKWADLVLAKRPVPAMLRIGKALADRLVFTKLKERTGGRIRFFISGGAPLGADIARFFYAAGLPILEGYGLTETSPVITLNTLEAPRPGTVGPPIPGVEVAIAQDGEIVARGPNIMAGYWNKPDATRDALDADGWFHTGDVGELDADGYLRITDRIKDLIVTAGGKKIAPQPIENLVRSSPFVLNAVMIGEGRKFPALLVTPNFEALRRWAAERNLQLTNPHDFLAQPDVVAKVEREVMLKLRDLAHFEMPKKILLVEQDFTVEGGELTPTLKVKRSVVEEKYKALIDSAYADETADTAAGA
jgi:long-chain acyl-CoA synthetase